MFKYSKSFPLLLTVFLSFVSCTSDAGIVILKYRVILSSSKTDVGCLLQWQVEQQVEERKDSDDRVSRYWEPCVGCACQIYRDGVLIATVRSEKEYTYYCDMDVLTGLVYEYQVSAMGALSNKRQLTCYGNGSSDVYLEVSDDSKVAAVLEGSADVKLVDNIKTATEYAAFREWALNLESVTTEEVKASPNAWLSYAFNTDKLIIAAPKEGDVVIDTFESTATEGVFELTVKIDGIAVGDNVLEANIKKVFDIEGAEKLASDGAGFSTDNVEVNAAALENGNVKFTVTPKGGALGTTHPTSFFFRVKMK